MCATCKGLLKPYNKPKRDKKEKNAQNKQNNSKQTRGKTMMKQAKK
jgi:hypothetical protein